MQDALQRSEPFAGLVLSASDLVVGHAAEHGPVPPAVPAGLLRVFHGLLDGAGGRQAVSGIDDLSLGDRETIDDGSCDKQDSGDQVGAIFLEKRLHIHVRGILTTKVSFFFHNFVIMMENGKCILVTGAAGFIGANLVKRLMEDGGFDRIIGVDSLNDYYDVRIKEYRLQQLADLAEATPSVAWTFVWGNIADKDLVSSLFREYRPAVVVNLAAQAGVRYSITNPDAYIESNLVGFFNILEACRHSYDEGAPGVEHLVYASSSSVYGSNAKVPYSTDDKVDNPISLYAATKKSNELMAHAYSKLYDIPSTGLRFFTVYGPAGRPDMAYFSFTDKLRAGEKIRIFNYGNCLRDFTYVDDIVEGVVRIIARPPERKKGPDGLPVPPYAVYNIGNSHPENLLEFVDILQQELVAAGVLPADYDFEAHKELVPMQAGDVPVTFADTSALERDFGFKPSTPLREGLRAFARWYKEFYL